MAKKNAKKDSGAPAPAPASPKGASGWPSELTARPAALVADTAAVWGPAAKAALSGSGSFELPAVDGGAFDSWLKGQLDASPPDSKDTDDFRYITFAELPPWTDLHKSLMRKTVTKELFAALQDVKSSKGYTLSNGMQAGVFRPHLGVGFTCGDEECFELFKDIINPIVQGWHGFDPSTQTHASDLDYAKLVFTNEDAALFSKYIKSTRVRAARNIAGFSLPAGSSKEDRLAVEEVLKTAFSNLPDNLKGTYYPLGELTSEQEDELQEGGFLFQKPGPMQLLGAAGAGRNWPEGRGIFHNPDKTVLCWCNEEDQCRIIAMENGGDVKGVFTRFCQLSNAIKAAAESTGRTLMEHPNYGFLGTCPSNLGTGLRGSVMIVLPELNKDPHKLEEICARFDLQPRGSSGEHSAAVGGKWDISNKQRIGFSEVQLVQKMIDGVKKLIAIEEELAAKNGGSDAAPAAEAEELATKQHGDSDTAPAAELEADAELEAENRALKVDNNDLREKLLSYADILERMQSQFSALQNAYEELKQQAAEASTKEVAKEVIKEVPVEKIVTVIKEVPVIKVEYRDREVVKEVPKIEYRYVESRRREDRPAEEPRVEHRHSPLTQEVQASRAASFEIGRNVMSHSPPGSAEQKRFVMMPKVTYEEVQVPYKVLIRNGVEEIVEPPQLPTGAVEVSASSHGGPSNGHVIPFEQWSKSSPSNGEFPSFVSRLEVPAQKGFSEAQAAQPFLRPNTFAPTP